MKRALGLTLLLLACRHRNVVLNRPATDDQRPYMLSMIGINRGDAGWTGGLVHLIQSIEERQKVLLFDPLLTEQDGNMVNLAHLLTQPGFQDLAFHSPGREWDDDWQGMTFICLCLHDQMERQFGQQG